VELAIHTTGVTSPGAREIEVVERKGIGHPDTVCDAIAEQVCVAFCRYYQEHFGLILHHNVDKVLLCGGTSRPVFGGGEVVEPIEIYLAGRAADEYCGVRIPTHEIAVQACREWLRTHLRSLDTDQHVRITPRLRPGSRDLMRLFARAGDVPLANDTAYGAGFAPLTELETTVLEVERALNSAETKRMNPEIGEDVKVMGVRRGKRIDLTISCAFVSRFVTDAEDYARKKAAAHEIALSAARRISALETEVQINTADDIEHGDVFLTVTGTSAEGGDEGEVGRGNRTSGLITPYRVMTLEAAAGKNPVSHPGKLYSIVAGHIAGSITTELSQVEDATCVLVSQIGRPVDDPQIVDIGLSLCKAEADETMVPRVTEIVRSHLSRLNLLRDALLAGEITVY
jgi:S-adenosylmethionine synthetase